MGAVILPTTQKMKTCQKVFASCSSLIYILQSSPGIEKIMLLITMVIQEETKTIKKGKYVDKHNCLKQQ